MSPTEDEPGVYRLSWTAGYRDLREATGWTMRHRRRGLLLTMRAIVVFMALLWAALAVGSHSPMVLGLLIVVCYGLLVVALPYLAALGTWNAAKKALARGTEAVVSDDGVRVRTGATEVRLGWADLLPPERARRLWLMPIVHAKGALFVPARAIPGPEEEFVAYVRDRIAAVKSGSAAQ